MTTRACPHPDCDVTIPPSLFACRDHWWSLPVELRARIWRSYRSGDVDRILDGYAEAAQHWGSA